MNISLSSFRLSCACATSSPNSSLINPTACAKQPGPVPMIQLLNQWQKVKDDLDSEAWQGHQSWSEDQKHELAPLLAEYWKACEDLLPAPSVVVRHLTAYGVTTFSREEPWSGVLDIYCSCLSIDDMQAVQSGLTRLNQAMAEIKLFFKKVDAQSAASKSALYLTIGMRLCSLFFSLLARVLSFLQLMHLLYECICEHDPKPLKTDKEEWEELAEQLKMFWTQEIYRGIGSACGKEALKEQIQKEVEILLEAKWQAGQRALETPPLRAESTPPVIMAAAVEKQPSEMQEDTLPSTAIRQAFWDAMASHNTAGSLPRMT